jgi:putative ABC transport system permease protein
MLVGPLARGIRNPFRSRVRAALVAALLAGVTGLLAVLVQAALASRQQIARLEGRVRTLIELREAGAFGTGGFGRDQPVGEGRFSTDTLARVRRIPQAAHLARVDEYVYAPEIDPTRPNAYAMVIGLPPGAALRAIGEVDYEHARLVAGRGFRPDEADARVAVAGRLYAQQRLGLAGPTPEGLAGREIGLDGRAFRLIGVYTTDNDFGDNHVFVPIGAFRATFRPGTKLSKIFVTVDSVAHVERVVEELRASLPEADVVTAPEAVSTARTTLASLAVASASAAGVLFAIGASLVVAVMLLSTRERVREIGTLKALGASQTEVTVQLLAEAMTLSALGGAGGVLVAAAAARAVPQAFGIPLGFDLRVLLGIALGSAAFAALGSLYPVVRGWRLSAVEAMRTR